MKKPSALFYLIKHIDKKAISELIPKFLEFDSKQLNADTNLINETENLKFKLLNLLFESLNVNSDIEKINNIASVVLDISENKYLLEVILNSKDILTNITKQLIIDTERFSSEQNYNYYEILLIFINLIKTAINENYKLPSLIIENIAGEDIVNINLDLKSIDNTYLGESILESLGKIIENFVAKSNIDNNTNNNNFFIDKLNEEDLTVIEGTFGACYKPLGLKK